MNKKLGGESLLYSVLLYCQNCRNFERIQIAKELPVKAIYKYKACPTCGCRTLKLK